MVLRLTLLASLIVGATACHKSSGSFDRGRAAARNRDWAGAVSHFERALADEPENIEYRIALDRARMQAARVRLARTRSFLEAGDAASAIAELTAALDYDPTNRYARAQLDELLAAEGAEPEALPTMRWSPLLPRSRVLDPSSSEPLRVKYPEGSSLRTVLESLAKLAGVNILFDESFRDRQVSVDLEAVSFREALDILMLTNGLFYKAMSTKTIRVTNEP